MNANHMINWSKTAAYSTALRTTVIQKETKHERNI